MKKTIAIILAAVLTFGIVTVAYANAGGKITDIVEAITDKDYTDIEVHPGKVYELPLTANMFEWSEGTGKSNEAVTKSQISKGNITVKATYNKSKSADVIKEISIEHNKSFSVTGGDKTSYVKVEFVDGYDSSNEFKFEFTVYLYRNGNRAKDSAVKFSGTFCNETMTIEEDEDYVDLSEGVMVEPMGYIRSIECYLGEGLYIRTKMYEDKSYYGTVEKGIRSVDAEIADAYPEIDTIYTLSTNITSGTVFFELDDEYYVYNADGKYVGTTKDELKYSKKYYLASEKIDLSSSSSSRDDDDDGDDVPVADEDNVPNENYSYGSGNTNINDNPNTGVKAMVNLAALIGLAAVTVLGVVARKKR